MITLIERVDGGVIIYLDTSVCASCPHRGQVQRRLPLLVLHGGVGSMGQQQRAQLGPPLLRRLVQRRERPLIGGVHARVVLDQQGGDVYVLDGGREVRNTRAAKLPIRARTSGLP